MSANTGGGRQGILPVAMKDKAHLYAAYMPYVKSGGLFVATNKRFDLGSEVFLLLTLPDSSEKLGVPGKVVRQVTEAEIERIKTTAAGYLARGQRYIRGAR